MKHKMKTKIIRDISWLSFNERVLQEAGDPNNHLYDRLRFLGIFSNNLDEFFRVRVAALNRMVRLKKQAKMHLEENPEQILEMIQVRVIKQQHSFDRIYTQLVNDLRDQHIFIKNEKQLNEEQKHFIRHYFENKVRTQIIPLMIESIPQMPLLHDRSIYLACVLGRKDNILTQRFALIEIPTKTLPRFIPLPSHKGTRDMILIEDIIRGNLKHIFAAFEFDRFLGYIVKVTRDAELDLDNDIDAGLIASLEKGLKNRKRGNATRFVYDRHIDPGLLEYLTKRLHLSKKDNLIAGGRIHNFKDFMSFPAFDDLKSHPKAFDHPDLIQPCLIMNVLKQKDILLHFPYHSFDAIIDLLREAAIDPFTQSIKITCYRLSRESKIINALVNAVRNGKKVTVVLEVRARFDEEANLVWKRLLEEEGAKVVIGQPDRKIHAKLCVIKKNVFNKSMAYGFFSTGNFNEDTAKYYGDHCLLTTNRKILADINRLFEAIEYPDKAANILSRIKTLPVAPYDMRKYFIARIDQEIHAAQNNKPAEIIIKLNSLVDQFLIDKLYDAAYAGVRVSLIVRGICCALSQHRSFKKPIKAVSIVDEYLEHARVFVFHDQGDPKVYISSADWMVRNLDHRIETACPVFDKKLKQELIDILKIQLMENVKGRVLDNHQRNKYVQRHENTPIVRAQHATYDYLLERKSNPRHLIPEHT
ncbi:MAG TPA: polyphosphate kinase 1 [Edaphocola sp.]|nr:polyphosphate kinase 1 [Edaphocola sp.]